MRTLVNTTEYRSLDSPKRRMNFIQIIILGLTIFYPLEEFLEKWIPRGLFYEAVRYGSELLLFFLLVWVIITRSIIVGKWRTTPIDFLLFLLLLFSLISSLVNNLPISVFLLGIRPFIRFLTVFYIIVQLGYNRIFTKRFAQICLISASLISLIAIFQSIIGLPATNFLLPGDVEFGGELVREGVRQTLASRTRVFSTLGRYDTLGTYLTIIILLASSLYWARAITKKNIYWFAILSIPAILLSYSRQSWLATTVGLVILMILHKKYKYLVGFGAASIVTFFVLLLFFSSYSYYSGNQVNIPFLNRFLEPFSQRYLEISRYNYGRLFVILEVSNRIIIRAPFLGFGPGNFGSVTTRFFGRDFSSLIDIRPESAYLINDVNWVTVLGQIGLIGIFLFAAILIIMMFKSRMNYKLASDPLIKGYASAMVAIMAAFIIMGFFGPNFEVRQVSFFVWAIAGIVFSVKTSRKTSQPTIYSTKPEHKVS